MSGFGAHSRQTAQGFDQVLAILPSGELADIPANVQQLVEDREQARQAGDFDQADALRAKLAALGYTVEDRQGGPRVKPSD